MASAVGPWGSYAYAYDGAGNQVQRTLTAGGATTYANAQVAEGTSNLVNGTTDQTGVSKRTLYYGYGGNLVYDQRVGGSTYSYLYSYRKRLVGVQVGGSTVGTYGYDFTGARVWRQASGTPAVNSQYVYDTAGHLLAEESGSTGAVIREYVWVDDMPLAVIDPSSGTAQTYYIHTGPVGEPLVMTDVNKNQVWNAYMEPFGLATVFGASSAALDLRLPGQWLTAETGGLNQNGFRDYDPTLGRYVQPDPVGLEAGQNVFPYVDGDPLDRIDPWGLQPYSGQMPPPGIPGGPWRPAGPGQPPGTFEGPKGPNQKICRYVPDQHNGGPRGAPESYWKTKTQGKPGGWPDRYNQNGQWMSDEEAHPGNPPANTTPVPEEPTVPEEPFIPPEIIPPP